MNEILQKLTAKKFPVVLQAYVKTWETATQGNGSVDTPLISIFLPQGGSLTGEITDINFEESMCVVRVVGKSRSMDISFISIEEVKSFILHQVDQYPHFVEMMASL